MQKYLVYFSLMIIFISCASMSDSNKAIQTNISFKSGLSANKTWDDSLTFKRTSWFQRAKMTQDVFWGEVPSSSPFRQWLASSKDLVESRCAQFYLAISYSNDLKGNSLGVVKSAIEQQGLTQMSLASFKAALRGHPAFINFNLENHKIMGYCLPRGKEAIKSIYVEFPGFTRAKIN